LATRATGLARENPRDRILQRKVENGIEPAVDTIEWRAAALEERRERRITVVDFAHGLETRVARVDGCRPVAPEASRHIERATWRWSLNFRSVKGEHAAETRHVLTAAAEAGGGLHRGSPATT